MARQSISALKVFALSNVNLISIQNFFSILNKTNLSRPNMNKIKRRKSRRNLRHSHLTTKRKIIKITKIIIPTRPNCKSSELFKSHKPKFSIWTKTPLKRNKKTKKNNLSISNPKVPPYSLGITLSNSDTTN